MPDREPKRRSTDPFSVFLTEATLSAEKPVDVALPPAGEALALTVRRLLAQRATSDAELELAKDIDRSSAAPLLYLADGEAHRIDEVAMHFDVAVKLTPAGSALIVEISEMVAPR
jgi:hypothetical protein